MIKCFGDNSQRFLAYIIITKQIRNSTARHLTRRTAMGTVRGWYRASGPLP